MSPKAEKTVSRINKQKEIEKRKRKKRKKRLIVIILLAVITMIIIYLLKSSTFKIQEIEIKGNQQIEKEQIEELSGIKRGENIFVQTEIVTKVKLKENGYIKDIKLEKKYPNKIEIEIEERQKQYQIQTETGEYIYIDGQGYILEKTINKAELKTITGMEIEDIQGKKRLEGKDLEKMEDILHIEDEAKKIEIKDKIQLIETKDEYIIHIDEDKITIKLGDISNLNDKMHYVKAILKKEEGNTGTVYVNGNINEGFTPYFSPR